MKKVLPFYPIATCTIAMACAAPLSALAQSQGAQNAPGNATGSQVRCEPRDPKDARPNDLRSALLQQRQRCDDTPDTSAAGRHLSPQEKAQLREQLRQQR